MATRNNIPSDWAKYRGLSIVSKLAPTLADYQNPRSSLISGILSIVFPKGVDGALPRE